MLSPVSLQFFQSRRTCFGRALLSRMREKPRAFWTGWKTIILTRCDKRSRRKSRGVPGAKQVHGADLGIDHAAVESFGGFGEMRQSDAIRGTGAKTIHCFIH